MNEYTIIKELESVMDYDAYLVKDQQGSEFYMRMYNVPKASDIHLLSNWKEMFEEMVFDISNSANAYLRSVIDGGFDKSKKKPYAVFEVLPDKTLESIVSEIDSLGEENTMKICQSILKALCSLRERGLVHSLVSPSKVVHKGASSEVTWVLDWDPMRSFFCKFHVAKPVSDKFSAPEIEGGVRASVRSDIYSVGKILQYCVGKNSLNSELQDWVELATSISPINRHRNPKHALNLLSAEDIEKTPMQVELREQPETTDVSLDLEQLPQKLSPEEETSLQTGNLRKENILRDVVLKVKSRMGKGPKP